MNRHSTCPAGLFCLGIIGLALFMFLLPGAAPSRAADDELRIALLPIVDSFPFHVAQEERLFESAGVSVTGLSVSSAVIRDQLMQSGEIDGMLNELMTTANFNRHQPRIKMVAVVRMADESHPLFRILGAPGGELHHPADLTGVPIGISRNTIIEYVTDRMLHNAGLSPETIYKQSVPSIPERYQLLLQGRLPAATLPDPLALSAMASGAVLLIDDRSLPGRSLSVLSFANQALLNKRDAIARFLEAWNQAVEHINTHPTDYRALLIKKIRIPPNVQADYAIPPFAFRLMPNRNQWQDVMEWMIGRRLLDHPLDFNSAVDPDLLVGSGKPTVQ